MTPSNYYTVAGTSFLLGPQIGRGAEGAVHEIPIWPGYLAKIYDATVLADPRRAGFLERKLRAQLQAGDLGKLPWLAWPLAEVRDAQGKFQGMVMRKMDGILLQHLMAPASVQQALPHWTQGHLLRVCHDLAAQMHVLESQEVYVADMGPGNFLVDRQSGEVRFIDTDSYQLGTSPNAFACPVMAPHFSAPEVLNRGTPGIRTPEEIRFGAALLFFSVLTLGASAFMQLRGASVPENIIAGRIAIGGASATAFMPRSYYTRYATLTPWIKRLFNDTLREGHGHPHRRVTFAEWQKAFCSALR